MGVLTPTVVLDDCVKVFPAFRDYWNSDDNLAREEDGSFTFGGVYVELTRFVRANWRSFSDTDWTAFAGVVNDHFRRDEESREALGACLIENLDFEEFSPIIARQFDKTLLRTFGFFGTTGGKENA